MTLNDKLFVVVPLFSLLCNAFLFLTCLSAKKSRLIYAFLELLTVFMAWTGGSLFMRLQVYPSADFWYEVSIMGIFLVPYFVYNFIYYFCEQKGFFIKNTLLVSWIITAALNLGHVFIKDPQVTMVNGERIFNFSVSWTIALPIALAILTFAAAWRIIVCGLKEDRVPLSHLKPLLWGVFIMFFGTVIDVFPVMVSLPNDTLSCGLNAIFLYYALYRKRLITLTHMASRGSSYLLSALFTSILLIAFYPSVDSFYSKNFTSLSEYKTIVVAVVFSLLTMLTYNLVHRLMNNLFTKRQEAHEVSLKKFSTAVGATLDLNELLTVYKEFLQENFPQRLVYICIANEKSELFETAACTQEMRDKSFSMALSHPLAQWLRTHKRSIVYDEFLRTQTYKSMWEQEKKQLVDLNPLFILPLECDNNLNGIAIFVRNSDKQDTLTFSQISNLESAAAVLSIALKNASLYASMQNEARHDALTGLYNRGYFTQCVQKEFTLARHNSAVLALISLDDFRLYNELYGEAEGDTALRFFSQYMRASLGSGAILARYSGKEFAAFWPFYDAQTVQDLLQKLQRSFVAPNPQAGKYLTFSAGICAYPVAASNPDEMFTYANMAVYRAKRSGKDSIVIYTPEKPSEKIAASAVAKRALAENCASTIYALTAAIDAKDHYTFQHSQNVAEYASVLAENIPLDSEHVEIIRQAGLLHDIGKIGIPEAILSKTTRLSAEEYEIMKTHAAGATTMIRHLPSLDYVVPSAIGHHERYDGKGYPHGISGETIPIGARCLCLADSFDAMTSKRSYKEALTVEQALVEIRRNLGTQFDPKLGLLFIELVENGTISVYGITT